METKNIFKSYIFKGFYSIIALIVVGVLLKLFIFSKDHDNDKMYQEVINKQFAIYAFPLPTTLSFAGEEMPMTNFDARENLDRELLRVAYYHSQTLQYIKKMPRYFQVMEPILQKNNIPNDFKYLAITESGLANVISPSKAVGVWQFLKETGKEFGLEINDDVDERYHLAKSTEAACKYLNKLFNKYKNWTLVAAAYNMGQGALDKQIDAQHVTSYYDLLLNEETSRYVFTIAAIKLVLTNPQNYGYRYRLHDLYPVIPTSEVEVDSAITNMVAFAEKYSLNYKMLKYFNPWLRSAKLPNPDKKKYYITIPKEGYRNHDYAQDITEPDTLIRFDSLIKKK